MSLIVVMEDDAGTRTLVASVLKKDGHDVLTAEDGAKGLLLVQEHRPDLVISDIQMPEVNGFQVLSALRSKPKLADIPVILLTSLQERAHMRIGMTTGADDYITKPFRPGELREAVAAQLTRRLMRSSLQTTVVDAAVKNALEEQKHNLAKLYELRLAQELSDRWQAGEAGADDEYFEQATVLFVSMSNYGAVAERLDASELTELVKKLYGRAGDTIHLFGAHLVRFFGEGILAVFVDSADTKSVNHGLRAARAAFGLAESANAMRQHIQTRYPKRNLPMLEVTIALNTGPVTLTVLQDPLHGPSNNVFPVGDVVSASMQLMKLTQPLGWGITASGNVLRGLAGAVKIGRRTSVAVPGRDAPIEAAELISLVT